MTTHYTLGNLIKFPANVTGEIVWKVGNEIEGIKVWARDERNGTYVNVLEYGPTEWVDGEPQAWSRGNFENLETAKKFASMAYRFINKGRR
jgi:hypothetical protein